MNTKSHDLEWDKPRPLFEGSWATQIPMISRMFPFTFQAYSSAGFVEQYWTRFLMREILGQLSAVQRPIDAASDVLEERAVEER